MSCNHRVQLSSHKCVPRWPMSEQFYTILSRHNATHILDFERRKGRVDFTNRQLRMKRYFVWKIKMFRKRILKFKTNLFLPPIVYFALQADFTICKNFNYVESQTLLANR